MKRKSITIGLSAMLFLSLAACGKEESAVDQKETTSQSQVLHLTDTDEIPTLNTTKATDPTSFRVMNNTMEGLYRNGENDKLEEGIAKDVAISEDGLTYTFTLREAKWSNGEPVRAQDFVYGLQSLLDPANGAEYAYIAYDIKNASEVNEGKMAVSKLGVEAKDDHTLVVTLENPVPYFQKLMTFPVFFPKNEKFEKKQGSKYGTEDNTVLYNGPFVLEDWEHEKSYTLKKNDQYWDKDTVKLEKVTYNIVKDNATAVNLYETGKIDLVNVDSAFMEKYKNDDNLHLDIAPTTVFLYLNERNKSLANEHLRNAISMSIDKESLVNAFLQDGSIATDYFVPSKIMVSDEGVPFQGESKKEITTSEKKEIEKEWNQAKEELGVQSITFELLTYDKDPYKQISEYLKEQLESNLEGLTINIKQNPVAQKLTLEKSFQYEISLSSWTSDYPDPMNFLDLFVSNAGNNRPGFQDSSYDTYIKQAKVDYALDTRKRWKTLETAERYLLDKDVIVPLYVKGHAYVLRDNVENMYYHSFGGSPSLKWVYKK